MVPRILHAHHCAADALGPVEKWDAATDHLKVGVTVRDWDCRKEASAAFEIECAIKRVMVDDEDNEIRKRAGSLGKGLRLAVGENGSSRTDFDSFVAYVTR